MRGLTFRLALKQKCHGMGAALQAEAAELRAAIQSEEDELQALCAQARPL